MGSCHADASTFSPDPCTRTGPRVPGQPGEGAGWSYALVRLLGDGTLPHRPLASLHRVFAVPEAVAEMAESLVRSWHTPIGEDGAEWEPAHEVRTAIDAVGSQFVSRKR